MKIRRRPFRPVSASESYSMDRDEIRSDGVHVMAIVSSIEETLARPGDVRHVSGSDLELYASGGFLWERVVAEAMAASDRDVFRPGEFGWCSTCHAGQGAGAALPGSWGRKHAEATGHTLIYGTPDGLSSDLVLLEEYKWTWKSENRAVTLRPDEFDALGAFVPRPDWVDDDTVEFGIWRWPIQCMSYCHLAGVERARMRVVFCNGNYKQMRPRAWEFDLAFSSAELQENWDMLVRHASAKGWLNNGTT